MSLHVLVIGGGVGGLGLAHGLKHRNISFHVYERDRTEDYRAQGYRFRLGTPGVNALEELVDAKTFQDFVVSSADLRAKPISEIDAETLKVVPPKLPDQPAPPSGGLQDRTRAVDRSVFRDVLIKNLEAEYITYGKKFERYEETADGVVAFFDDGSTAKGSLLVGADGAYSRVRKQLLPDLEPAETGAVCIYGKTPLTPDALSRIEPTATTSMSVIKDRAHTDIVMGICDPVVFNRREEAIARGIKMPIDYLFWGVSGKPAVLGLEPGRHRQLGPEASAKHVVELTKHWHPAVRAIVEGQQIGESSAFTVTCVKPEYPAWEPNGHVTGLGDAMHKMAPTGSGAVLALKDAQTLCDLLAEKGQSKETVGEYEERMRNRARKDIGMSWMAIRTTMMTKDNEKHFGEMAMALRAKKVVDEPNK